MTARRVLKVAEAIRETVSLAILTELRDPRVRDVTVTFVEVSADLRHAKVHVSVMGDDRKESLVVHGLDAAAGFLQRKVADRLDTRYIPRLKFVIDKGVKHSMAVARILDEVLPPELEGGASSPFSTMPTETSERFTSQPHRLGPARDEDEDEEDDEEFEDDDDLEDEDLEEELDEEELDEDFDDEDDSFEDDEDEEDDDDDSETSK